MFTECPTCNTLFRVRPAQLNAAGGKVRCGECLAVFDAREYLREDLEEPAETSVVPEPSPTAAHEGQTTLPLEVAAEELAPAATGPEAVEPQPDAEPEASESEPKPPSAPLPARSAAREPELPFTTVPPAKPHTNRAWTALSGLLLFLFLGQFVWFNREALLAIPSLHPVAEALCGAADCLPTANDPSAFELTGRGVQTHPAYQGALLIDATFVNRSDTARAYPKLELVFTDPEGTPLASRRFEPVEYLGQKPQQPLAPGAEAHVVLELLDPGDLAVGYEFRFF